MLMIKGFIDYESINGHTNEGVAFFLNKVQDVMYSKFIELNE